MNRPITYGRGSVCHSNHEHYRDPTAAAAFEHMKQEEYQRKIAKEAAERAARNKEKQRRLAAKQKAKAAANKKSVRGTVLADTPKGVRRTVPTDNFTDREATI